MALTPVEIRHLRPSTGFMGYKRGQTDRLFEEIAVAFEVEELEVDLVRFRELETLLRTTLVSAERAATEVKEQARREADLILTEAQAEVRAVQRNAIAENERLIVESRRLRAQLRAALETIDDVQVAEDAQPAEDDGQNSWPGEREAA